jgi:hypothetical protein
MTDPTWFVLAGQARATLKAWDRWCPDDGRPLAAWQAVMQHARTPIAASSSAVEEARRAVRAAFEMAWTRYAAHPAEDAPYYAAMAAGAVHELCAYFTRPQQYDWLGEARRSIALARAAVPE